MTIPRNIAKRAGYTLIEVLAAGAVIAIGTTAAVSLSASLLVQEEFSWRVAVVRNYEENMARLWQLGLTPAEVVGIMPTPQNNPLLALQLYGTPGIQELGVQALDNDAATPDVDVAVETAQVTAAVNISSDPRPGNQEQGSTQSLTVCRPVIR